MPVHFKATKVAIYVFAICMLASSPAHALVTDFTVDHLPIIFGDQVTFTANDPQWPVKSITWEYRCVDSGCTGNWLTASTSDTETSVTFTYLYVGRTEVRLTVKYDEPSGGGEIPPDFTKIRYVDVLGPDSCEPIPGLNTWTNFDQQCELRFQLKRGDKSLSDTIGGFPQEYIVKGGVALGTWSPLGPDNTGVFYLEGSVLVDNQGQSFSQDDWDQIPDGEYDRIKIRYRLVVGNCCSIQQTFPMTTFELIRIKSGNQFKIVEVTPRPDPIP